MFLMGLVNYTDIQNDEAVKSPFFKENNNGEIRSLIGLVDLVFVSAVLFWMSEQIVMMINQPIVGPFNEGQT